MQKLHNWQSRVVLEQVDLAMTDSGKVCSAAPIGSSEAVEFTEEADLEQDANLNMAMYEAHRKNESNVSYGCLASKEVSFTHKYSR